MSGLISVTMPGDRARPGRVTLSLHRSRPSPRYDGEKLVAALRPGSDFGQGPESVNDSHGMPTGGEYFL